MLMADVTIAKILLALLAELTSIVIGRTNACYQS